MSWLGTILKALFSALFDWGQKQAEKPETIQNANTPENVKRGWRDYLRDRLRDKNDGRN